MTETQDIKPEVCVAYVHDHDSGINIRITKVPVDLYRTLKRQQYSRWSLYVRQALNYMSVVLHIAIYSTMVFPSMLLWLSVYTDVQATIQDLASTFIHHLFPLSLVMSIFTCIFLSKSHFGLRNVFSEQFVYEMRQRIPELRPYTSGMHFTIYTGESAEMFSDKEYE